MFQKICDAQEERSLPALAGEQPQRARKIRFSDPGRADKDQSLSLLAPLELGEMPEIRLADPTRERQIELLERGALSDLGADFAC